MAGHDEQRYRYAFPETAHGSVRFGRTEGGTEPAWEFWQTQMTVKQQAAFGTLFRMIASNPRLQLPNRQKFKQVVGDLWEFKSIGHKMRLFCFRHGNAWYLTSGLAGKKEDDLPPGEVNRALDIMAQCKRELQRYELSSKDMSRRHY